MKKERTLKLVAIGSMLAISIFTVSCDKLNGLEPKSFADIFEDKIVGEWTVDSIKYTTFDINNKKTDETIKPAGKVTFVRTDDSKGADLRAAQGYMFNTYLKDGKNLKDTTAYSYDINGNLDVVYFITQSRATDKTFIAGPKTIYDIKDITKNVFYIERNERLVSSNGQFYGSLRSVIKMHR
jgi:hypothetical protein